MRQKVENLEKECKKQTDEVFNIKSEEDKLRSEFQITQRKVLYALSRLDLSSFGIRPNFSDISRLVDNLTKLISKQKIGHKRAVDALQRVIEDIDL